MDSTRSAVRATDQQRDRRLTKAPEHRPEGSGLPGAFAMASAILASYLNLPGSLPLAMAARSLSVRRASLFNGLSTEAAVDTVVTLTAADANSSPKSLSERARHPDDELAGTS